MNFTLRRPYRFVRIVGLCLTVLASSPCAWAAVDNSPYRIEWTRSFSSPSFIGSRAFAGAVAFDPNGFVIAGGEIYESDADALPGRTDAVVQKYDLLGNRQWSATLSSTEREQVSGLAVDMTGKVYVTGTTYGTFSGFASAGNSDIYIAQYDSVGNLNWVQQLGTSGNDSSLGVAVSNSGGAYITGEVQGVLPGEVRLGSGDFFLAKYNDFGEQIWLKQFGTPHLENAFSVAVDSNDNVYLTGRSRGFVSFPSPSLAKEHLILMKFDSDGNRVWAKDSFLPDSVGTEVVVDPNGYAYVSGYTRTTNDGGRDAILIKYDPSGNVVWNRQFGFGESEFAQDLAIGPEGDLFVSGFFYRGIDTNDKDVFVSRFDSDGNELWTEIYSSQQGSEAWSIAMDEQGSAYLTVHSTGVYAEFNNPGIDEGYLVKLSVPEPSSFFFLIITACVCGLRRRL